MEQLNSKLSRVSEDFGAILDKASSEPEFRWQLINKKDEIMEPYGITEKNDIVVFDEIIKKLKMFIMDKAIEQEEFKKFNGNNGKKFNRTNPNVKYEQALLKRN